MKAVLSSALESLSEGGNQMNGKPYELDKKKAVKFIHGFLKAVHKVS
jgi:hypothetical protein